MTATDLKLKIIKKVSSINDELILEEINKLVDLENDLENDLETIFELSGAEKKAITEGLEDVKAGRVWTNNS